MSQNEQAGRDIIKVGRDYIRHIQINILSGNWGAVIISLIPVLLAIYILIVGANWTLGIIGNQSEDVSTNATLNQGEVQIFGLGSSGISPFLSIQASSENGMVNIILSQVPFSEYQKGVIKLGKGFQGDGTLIVGSTQGVKEYKTNTDGTDLTIKLDANPTQKGEFVKGTLFGTINDGTKSRKVSYKIVVPIQ
mgnify:CR=1 FL=1